jgi:stage V sporulation protein SpoVS
MSDAVLELNHDVDRWLLVLADPRRMEARGLLRRADDWTMLCTCDHDGIVSGYRTLKGLAEGEKAPLSLAMIDAPSEAQAEKVFGKLAAVCRQFLDWDVEHDVLKDDVEHAQVHTVLWCHTADSSNNAQHRVIESFLEMTPDSKADAAHYGTKQPAATDEADENAAVANQPLSIPTIARPLPTPAAIELDAIPAVADEAVANEAITNEAVTIPTTPTNITLPTQPIESPLMTNPMKITAAQDQVGEVIDLPDGASILSAVLKSGTQLIATPITPPMCAGATVAVGRDRGLVLVAQAESGLAGMESIAHAVRWLDDSKQLIAMAMPQLAIDAAAPTRVQLLIDHNDRTAEGIRPLLGDSRITIRSYRKLRWAGRTGLLLDAA